MMLVGAGALPIPFRSGWDHEFESAFLQRRVGCEPACEIAAKLGIKKTALIRVHAGVAAIEIERLQDAIKRPKSSGDAAWVARAGAPRMPLRSP
jgi:hypothetical protein